MVMTETTFSEFVDFINTHPHWRDKLLTALFPDINIAKAFQDLAETQLQIQLALQALTERVGQIESDMSILKGDVTLLKDRVGTLEDRVEQGFAEAAAERTEMKQDINQLKRDVAQIKGFNYESRIIQHADAIFGRFMRRGHNARNEIGLLLEEAEDNGLITEQEHDHVLALDLLWGGKQKGTKADIVLAIEVSWRAEEIDIKRAVSRSEILRKMGLIALPMVAGLEWDEAMITVAHQHKVAFMTDKAVNEPSWYNALPL